jgi:uncharacterized membrane protein
LITSLMVNLTPVLIFLLSCFFLKSKWQVSKCLFSRIRKM